MFVVMAIGFAWVLPQEEIDEIDKRLDKKNNRKNGNNNL